MIKIFADTDVCLDLLSARKPFNAIASDFSDFEYAIQYNTAIENNIKILVTRNLKDYKKAVIQIMNPETFLSGQK